MPVQAKNRKPLPLPSYAQLYYFLLLVVFLVVGLQYRGNFLHFLGESVFKNSLKGERPLDSSVYII